MIFSLSPSDVWKKSQFKPPEHCLYLVRHCDRRGWISIVNPLALSGIECAVLRPLWSFPWKPRPQTCKSTNIIKGQAPDAHSLDECNLSAILYHNAFKCGAWALFIRPHCGHFRLHLVDFITYSVAFTVNAIVIPFNVLKTLEKSHATRRQNEFELATNSIDLNSYLQPIGDRFHFVFVTFCLLRVIPLYVDQTLVQIT